VASSTASAARARPRASLHRSTEERTGLNRAVDEDSWPDSIRDGNLARSADRDASFGVFKSKTLDLEDRAG
jgi:hypothetical protein